MNGWRCLNPNGRPNSDVLRPYFNGMDLTRGSRGVWIIDFGVGTPMEEAALYEAPFEYVAANVETSKRINKRATYQPKWWLHERPRTGDACRLKLLKRYIGTSMVSKHFFFSWIPAEVLPANLLIVVARDDDYFFGVLHSHVHELWARRTGTQLREAESGFRYTPTTTFDTFPCPWPPGREPADDPRVQAIAAAAADLVAKRDAWSIQPSHRTPKRKQRTLTNLYNVWPAWLDLAHRRSTRPCSPRTGGPRSDRRRNSGAIVGAEPGTSGKGGTEVATFGQSGPRLRHHDVLVGQPISELASNWRRRRS